MEIRQTLEQHYTRYAGHRVHHRKGPPLHAAVAQRQADRRRRAEIAVDMVDESSSARKRRSCASSPSSSTSCCARSSMPTTSSGSRRAAYRQGPERRPRRRRRPRRLQRRRRRGLGQARRAGHPGPRRTNPEDIGGMDAAEGILTAQRRHDQPRRRWSPARWARSASPAAARWTSTTQTHRSVGDRPSRKATGSPSTARPARSSSASSRRALRGPAGAAREEHRRPQESGSTSTSPS